MPSQVSDAAQAIADVLAQNAATPYARWRWGTVSAVNSDGTMDVEVAGATLSGIRSARHAMTASQGNRVRIMYCGTEAVVDAVSADGRGSRTVIYSNATGTNGTVALSAPASRFAHLTIYYKQDVQDGGWDYGGCSSVDVYMPDGKHVEIGMTRYTGDSTWVYQTTRATLLVSGSQIIVQNAGYINQRSGGTPTLAYGTNNLYVYCVEGW